MTLTDDTLDMFRAGASHPHLVSTQTECQLQSAKLRIRPSAALAGYPTLFQSFTFPKLEELSFSNGSVTSLSTLLSACAPRRLDLRDCDGLTLRSLFSLLRPLLNLTELILQGLVLPEGDFLVTENCHSHHNTQASTIVTLPHLSRLRISLLHGDSSIHMLQHLCIPSWTIVELHAFAVRSADTTFRDLTSAALIMQLCGEEHDEQHKVFRPLSISVGQSNRIGIDLWIDRHPPDYLLRYLELGKTWGDDHRFLGDYSDNTRCHDEHGHFRLTLSMSDLDFALRLLRQLPSSSIQSAVVEEHEYCLYRGNLWEDLFSSLSSVEELMLVYHIEHSASVEASYQNQRLVTRKTPASTLFSALKVLRLKELRCSLRRNPAFETELIHVVLDLLSRNSCTSDQRFSLEFCS